MQTLVETIKEVKVNISLLTILKSNLKNNRMLKDFVAHIHAVEDLDCMEKVVPSGHCVEIIEGKLPLKMKDLGSFVLTCGVE